MFSVKEAPTAAKVNGRLRSNASATERNLSIHNIRHYVVGIDELVPLLDGSRRPYINFDNAASTPTISLITEKVNDFLKWYSNVHRGTGFKSKLSSWVFEEARDIVADFVRADLSDSVVLFCKNTTEAINKLARRFPFKRGDVVLTSLMEHHSNELPWRKVAHVVHIDVDSDGRIDEDDFQKKLKRHDSKVKLVAVSGASNVTGFINPVHTYARWAHNAGAQILVDAAQLAPHRPIDMKPKDSTEHLDYLAFSAHKMYAPFGVGVLVGRRRTFEQGDPEYVGGGTVDIVNLEDAYWTDLPDKEEAGTPDIVGAVALAEAIHIVQRIGWDALIEHEAKLTKYALEKLEKIPGVILYGDKDPLTANQRLGVLTFNVNDLPHSLVASILSYERGIGTRNGCFCAHPYVKCLLHVDKKEAKQMEKQILHRDRSTLPGFIRASFGMYNTVEEVDVLVEALAAIAQGKFRDGYLLNKERGEYYRNDVEEKFEEYFQLD
ncbi:MAG: aminotransferase class V-fold PLP-dependent enzyme [Bacteroidota bacterium]|nr:aminotransferase class V-fold PLP-dependent enzyme [Bacteroidota bacterium]